MQLQVSTNYQGRSSPSRRVTALVVMVMLFCVVILARLFDRAVLQSGLAEARALSQQEVEIKLNPNRGSILVHGDTENDYVPLALNEPRSTVDLVPRNIKDKQGTATKLASLLNIKEDTIFQAINNDKPYIPPIARNIPIVTGQQIDNLHMSGVSVSSEPLRTYPEGKLASQIIGFVNADGNGQYGVEGYYDSQLQGLSSNVVGQRDGWGNLTVDKSSVTSNKGADIVLTIDRDVQATVEQMLKDAVDKFKAKSGSVVIVEPSTGKIIAMANIPTFDPNAFFQVKSEGQSVFMNSAISRTFEPGSVMKTMSIASGLDSTRINLTDQGNYGSSVKVDNYEIHTATNQAFGHETATDVLVNSDNVAMVDISGKIGRDLLDDYLTRFGFGQKSGIDMDTESAGSKPPLKNWSAVSTATISFGQGISVTPLQMVMAYAAVANKGVYMQPYVVDTIIYPDKKKDLLQPKKVRQVIGEQADAEVTDMLVQVVTRGHGKSAGVAGYTVAGKTGTAQIPRLDGRGYIEDQHNGSFAGFAPVEDPKFAMFVTLEEPQGVAFAESSAAPLWGQIASYLLKNHYHVQPKQ